MAYKRNFLPYALAAFLIGLIGGFSTVLGPAFVQELDLSYNNTTWTALAQAVSSAACAPILGKMADVIGRKATLLLGLLVFTLGNMLTALAPSLAVMLLARFIVGIGIAAMSPVILAYIVTEFPPDRVAGGFSFYMLISSASVTVGPILGSLMVSGFGWRSMIWLCTGICAVVLLACLALGEKNHGVRKSIKGFDAAGALLVLVFFGLMLCIPSFGQNFGWTSRPFFIVLLSSALALWGLISAEKRAKNPILPKNLITKPSFVLSVLALFLTQGLMQANMTNTIVFVNYTQPGNTLISGYAISIMYLGMSLGAVLLGPLADRFEPKVVLTGSLFLTALGCGSLLFCSETVSAGVLMISLGLLGLGLGGNGTIFMKVALSGLSREATGAGTGTYGLFRDLAAPFGVAVFVPLFTNQITVHLAAGTAISTATVRAIRFLAIVELICVAGGILAVRFLPNIHKDKGDSV